MTSEDLQAEMTDRLERRPWPARPLRPGAEVSFEFFPPGGERGAAALLAAATRLASFGPSFASVTYGAGGSTQDRTLEALGALADAVPGVDLAGHLTCIGASRATLHGVLDAYRELGVLRVIALRGDDNEALGDGELESAADLVELIRARPDGAQWDISVAGYPEVHPLAGDAAADLDNLRRKVDAGADRVITQFFFDNDAFLRFHSAARSAGVGVPIVPGIMPIGDFDRVARFANQCGASIPPWMPDLFGGLDADDDVGQLVAATVAAEQCRHLAERGIDRFHFYTMNRAELVESVCRILALPTAPSATGATGATGAERSVS